MHLCRVRPTSYPLGKVRLAALHKAIADRAILGTEVNLLGSRCMIDLATKLVNSAVWSVRTELQRIAADLVPDGVLQIPALAQDLAITLSCDS